MEMNPLDRQGVMSHSFYYCLLVFNSIYSCIDSASIPLRSIDFQCFLKIFSTKPSVFFISDFSYLQMHMLKLRSFLHMFLHMLWCIPVMWQENFVFSHLWRLEANGQCTGAPFATFLSLGLKMSTFLLASHMTFAWWSYNKMFCSCKFTFHGS